MKLNKTFKGVVKAGSFFSLLGLITFSYQNCAKNGAADRVLVQQSCEGRGAVRVSGSLFYDSLLLSVISSAKPYFTVYDRSAQVYLNSFCVEYSSGSYKIFGLRDGDYSIRAYVNTNSGNPPDLADDMFSWEEVFLLGVVGSATVNIKLNKIIQLYEPFDNSQPITQIPLCGSPATGPFVSSHVTFRWRSLGPDVEYYYSVEEPFCDGTTRTTTIVDGTTLLTELTLDLPASRLLEFRVYASKGGVDLGVLMANGCNGDRCLDFLKFRTN